MKHLIRKTILACVVLLAFSGAQAQQKATATIKADSGNVTISKHIYGHFAEHLGTGIYGGIWVGENSTIPNTNGVRNDVIAALKKIKLYARNGNAECVTLLPAETCPTVGKPK